MMFWARPYCPLSVGRDLNIFAALLVASHVAQQTRIAVLHIGCPYLLLGFFELTGGIRDMTACIEFAAARIDHGVSVGREAEARDRHSVIALVMRNLARLEVGSVGDPDVAFPFVVEHPGHARCLHGTREAGWKGRTHHLLNCEARPLSRSGNSKQQRD